MQSYYTQVTNHASYIVTLTIGIAALIVSKDIREFFRKHKLILCLTLALLFALIVYFAYRIVYWSWMTSEVTRITQSDLTALNESTDYVRIYHILNERFIGLVSDNQTGLIYRVASIFYIIDQKVVIFSILLLTGVIFSLINISRLVYQSCNKSKNRCLIIIRKHSEIIAVIIPLTLVIIAIYGALLYCGVI
jgi:uncharacterized protein YqgQ